MGTITTKDGVEIFYKDLGEGQPIVFSHGWPLSADDWDYQIYYFASRGFWCIIKTFSETDFTEDLKKFDVPTLVMHGDDDQIVPIADSAMLSSKLVPNAQLKVYSGFPHGMCTTHHETVNADLLEFFTS
jgi:non-heme chloroperoxidase